MDIRGHVAIITGGGSGLGAATALRLAKKGALIAIFDRNIEAAHQIADPTQGKAYGVDVTDAKAVEEALVQVTKDLGCPRICVNCAGVAPAQRTVGREGPMDLQAFRQVIEINLIGTFNVVRCFAANLSTQEALNADGERGVIINTASVAAYEGQIGQAAYSASKGGIVSMTLPLAREFSKFGIRVNAIAPGIFATPMLLGMPAEVRASLGAMVPFPARLGQPDEYAHLVEHLAENTMLNGEVIRLDGAIRMQPK